MDTCNWNLLTLLLLLLILLYFGGKWDSNFQNITQFLFNLQFSYFISFSEVIKHFFLFLFCFSCQFQFLFLFFFFFYPLSHRLSNENMNKITDCPWICWPLSKNLVQKRKLTSDNEFVDFINSIKPLRFYEKNLSCLRKSKYTSMYTH